MKRLIVSVAALAAAGNAHAATNIVTNGGFEDTVISGPTTVNGYQQFDAVSTGIAGWTVTGGSADLVKSPYAVNDGAQALDLTGVAPGTISQILNTVAGQVYNLVFYVNSNNGGIGTGPYQGTVSVGGFSGTFSHVGGDPWKKYTGSFVGTGSDTLSFTSLTNISNGGPILDSISVSAAPEPATWLMMIAGFGLVGASLRRKRAKVNVRFA